MKDFNLDSNLDTPEKIKNYIKNLKRGMEFALNKSLTTVEVANNLTKCLLPPLNDNFTIQELASMKHALKNKILWISDLSN